MMPIKESTQRRNRESERIIHGFTYSHIRNITSERGIALMMTLWILVILTVIAMNFSFSTRYGSMGTRNFKTDTRAYYLAVSAYEDTLLYLLSDKDPKVDFIDEDGNFRTDTEREPITGTTNLDGAEVTLNISDEESRLNINDMKRDVLLNLLGQAAVPDDSLHIIADSITDWIDEDDLHHISGAEDEHYAALGYRAKNSRMDVPEELLLIRGFMPEYLYETTKEASGTEEQAPINELITTWGDGINVNTAPANVLRLLGLDAVEVDSILSQRKDQGIKTLPQKLQGIGTTKSKHFRITVEARLSDSPLAVRITSIVKRATLPEEPPLKTIYWKEELEAPASLKEQEDLESTGA
jgi:general secretion pathway protein K